METIDSVTNWANKTFGEATLYAQLRKAEDEWQELLTAWDAWAEAKANHFDSTEFEKLLVREAADVCITLYRVIGTLQPTAIDDKMKINRARKWKLKGDGTAQHSKVV